MRHVGPLRMRRPLQLLGLTLRWLLAMAAIMFGLAMVYSSVLKPLTSGTAPQLDQAVFACGVLLAAGTIAYYCKARTSVAKWASYFMVLFSIWAHALAYLSVRLLAGGVIETGEYLRMGAGALVLVMFGIRWAKVYCIHHSTRQPVA